MRFGDKLLRLWYMGVDINYLMENLSILWIQ